MLINIALALVRRTAAAVALDGWRVRHAACIFSSYVVWQFDADRLPVCVLTQSGLALLPSFDPHSSLIIAIQLNWFLVLF